MRDQQPYDLWPCHLQCLLTYPVFDESGAGDAALIVIEITWGGIRDKVVYIGPFGEDGALRLVAICE
jgi:hypothetical protein